MAQALAGEGGQDGEGGRDLRGGVGREREAKAMGVAHGAEEARGVVLKAGRVQGAEGAGGEVGQPAARTAG